MPSALANAPMSTRPASPVFAWSFRIHKMTSVVLILSVCGHVLIASGLLRAYRGVHLAMHRGGQVSWDTARMLWPHWAERARLPGDQTPEELDRPSKCLTGGR
jgi:hypothetical protein